jgi:hypothetical protein
LESFRWQTVIQKNNAVSRKQTEIGLRKKEKKWNRLLKVIGNIVNINFHPPNASGLLFSLSVSRF